MARSPRSRTVAPEFRNNNRGGVRTGTPGQVYPQRSDLNAAPAAGTPPPAPAQPVRTAPGQPYGQATAQAAAQHAIPLPNNTAMPTALTHPAAPTDRPDEHVMAGSPSGPGPGPSALTLPPGQALPNAPDPTDILRLLVSQHPNIPELRIMADQALQGQ